MNQAQVTKFIFEKDSIPQKGVIVSGAIIGLSKKYIKSPILDMGAGSGVLISKLAEKYNNCSGIDLFPKSGFVRYGDITDTHLQDGSIGTIFCTDVIEHLSDIDLGATILEMYRILKSSGYAIITTIYNEDLVRNYVTCPQCKHTFHRRGHCQVFSEERIRKLFRCFDIVETHTLKLHLEASFGPLLAKMFYLFKLDRLVKFHEKDLFIVVRKK